MDGRCFYCNQAIGDCHKQDCCLVTKKVLVRATIEYEITVPSDWTDADIEFHRNDGSWCANNIARELTKEVERRGDNGCLCRSINYVVLKVTGEPELNEH
jgi:hypothetical protein